MHRRCLPLPRLLLMATATLCAVVLSACGATISAGSTSAASGGLSEDLAFSGAMTGHVASATPSTSCGKGLVFAYEAEFVVNVGDGPRDVSIAVGKYHGPGQYAVSTSPSVTSSGFPDPTAITTVEIFHAAAARPTPARNGAVTISGDVPEYATISGRVVVNNDGHSGSVDVVLTPSNGSPIGDAASSKRLTVSGTWTCG